MKYFKIIEFYVNVFLIITFTLIFLNDADKFEILFIGYFVVGGVQVTGMIFHALFNWFTHRGGRRHFYHWLTAVLVALMPTGIIFYLLFWLAPILAIYYSFLCWSELQFIRKRELIHLK